MTKIRKYKGRIIGRSITEIYVRALHDTNLVLGEILIAGEGDTRFFLRVVDVSYGWEAGNAGWAIGVAGSMIEMEQSDRGFVMHDRARRNFEIGKCVIMGYTKQGEFRRAKTLPELFSQVFIPDADDFNFIKDYAGDLRVGKLRSGEELLDFEVGMGSGYIQSHIGIFATTGMGKSNLMKRLAASVMESHNVGMLIFDPHGEYYEGGERDKRGLKHHFRAKDNLTVFSYRKLSEKSNGLRINHREIDIEDLLHLFEFSQAQMEAAYALHNCFGNDWLKILSESEGAELAKEMPSSKFHEMTIAVLQRRARQILKQEIFHKDDTVSVTDAIITELKKAKVVLIDLSGLSGWRELLPAAVIARKVFDVYRHAFRKPEEFRSLPKVSIVLEEAQRVLGQLSGIKENIFTRICREGRKFKVGLTAITQQPKLIDEEIISQFNTLFVLGLADERDRNIIRSSARQDFSELSREIQMLQPGEALISSPQAPFAIPAKVDLYEDHIKNQKESVKTRDEIPSPDRNFFG